MRRKERKQENGNQEGKKKKKREATYRFTIFVFIENALTGMEVIALLLRALERFKFEITPNIQLCLILSNCA